MYVVRANGRYRSNKLLNFLSFGDSFFLLRRGDAETKCLRNVFLYPFAPPLSSPICRQKYERIFLSIVSVEQLAFCCAIISQLYSRKN